MLFRSIAAGARSGELTAKETQRLERGQARVDKRQQRAMADGQMSAVEQNKIYKAQQHQRRAIKRLDSNKREQPPA